VPALARVADRLEDLVRIRAGVGLATERGPVDLARICRDVIGAHQAAHPGAFVGLGTLGDATCAGDGARLAQAVGELLDNALRHGEPGTTAVVVDGTASELVLRCRNDGVLSERSVAAILDPAPGDPAKRPLALGLGLLIVHRIVADHGGTLELRSAEERGTTFTMRLPRSGRTAR
jgi:phosphoserine phosphatase RsbU/P